jgi:hypothetical protein
MIHPDLEGEIEALINSNHPPISDQDSDSDVSQRDENDESDILPDPPTLTSHVNATTQNNSSIATLQTTLGLSDSVFETVQQWSNVSATPPCHFHQKHLS